MTFGNTSETSVQSIVETLAKSTKVGALLAHETVAITASLMRTLLSLDATVSELEELQRMNLPEPEKSRERIAAVMCMILPSTEGKIHLSVAAEELPRLNMILEARGASVTRRQQICDLFAIIVIALRAIRSKTQ